MKLVRKRLTSLFHIAVQKMPYCFMQKTSFTGRNTKLSRLSRSTVYVCMLVFSTNSSVKIADSLSFLV